MSLPRPTRIFASASFRLTMVYATLFVIVTLAAIFTVGGLTVLLLKADIKDEVASEIQALETIDAEDGGAALAAAVDAHAAAGVSRGLRYQLNADDGALLAGGLGIVPPAPGWFEFVPPGEEDDELYLARAVALAGGRRLVVAADLEAVDDTRELMMTGIGWTLAISLPLALVCGAMMSVMVLRRIETINTTTRQIREGSLGQRAPLSGTGDEFDRLTAHINSMLDSIETLTRNVQEVSSGIAHDLRTPLTRVSNRLQALQGENISRERLESEIAAILQQIGAVLATFDALLRIGQIEAGTRRAGFRRLDLSALVGELAETYEVMAEANDKCLSSRIAPGIAFHGDRALLVQMVANVLDNAIVHTPAGTRISLSLDDGKEGVRLTVADDGPGIAAEERERVLARFYRADGSRGTNGNGLGMSIVNSISTLHGITLRIADNAPGLRIDFAFPAAPRPAE